MNEPGWYREAEALAPVFFIQERELFLFLQPKGGGSDVESDLSDLLTHTQTTQTIKLNCPGTD